MKQFWITTMVFLLAACVTPVTTQADIQSVTFTSTTGTVAPQYWRGTTLTVTSDLKTKRVVEGAYGSEMLETKEGTITQVQFDSLVKALNDADFTRVKSTALNPRPVGGGSSSLTVQTGKEKYEFSGPTTSVFPKAIGEIFDGRGQYMPQ